ncbi:(R)-amidase [Modicisalibacter muralis]|uniref:(R)-amidase n=1 Tax=Modicisalibacter muralis TaxID=119000 RepID=A0A1G9RRK7_9GAMM|nr:carbon-nitrogen hydrolase family protein [Halomonas muralis]SDM25949.1 (R)-amidase [Halomonas muralis]
MNIELAQVPGIEGDLDANLGLALAYIERAREDTDLIIFPETHLTGFAEQGAAASRAISPNDPVFHTLHQAAERQNLAIALGFLERDDADGCFNASVLITPEDGILLHYRKTHLWTDERALVTPGDRLVCVEWRGRRIGLMICYDLEFPETARALATLGAELIVITNGNMDPYEPVHHHLARARAIENQCFVAMANRCGTGAGYTFAGGSAVFAPNGECLAQLQREEGSTHAAIDFSLNRTARGTYDYLADRRIPLVDQNDAKDQRIRHFQLPDTDASPQ